MQLSDHEHDWLTCKGAEMLAQLGVSAGTSALAFDVLQYIDDWPCLFTALRRVLTPTGILHIYPAAIPHPQAIDLDRLSSTLANGNFRYQSQRPFTMMHNKHMTTDIVHTYWVEAV